MPHAALTARALRAGALAALVTLAVSACGGSQAATPEGPAGSLAPGTNRGEPAPRPESIDDTSPEGAVSGFVAAEAAEAYDLSYGLLRAAERDAAGSEEGWRDLHAGEWPLAGGEVTGADADGDTATVEVQMRYHSSLDETLGLVPARGAARWKAVREGDRWRVAFDDVEVEPVLPDDASAADRVKEWARARRACQAGEQYEGGLAGFPALADELCDREGGGDGDVEVGATEELDAGPDADQLIASFGPGALTWARVVPVTEPAGVLRAVVAPIGDRWTVVGVLDPAPAR